MAVPIPNDLKGHSLLAVFAHPDDESLSCGGLLAWCAERGVRVSLLCATHGENGQGSEPGRSASSGQGSLRDVRERELRAAARVLGVTDLLLLDYEDGMLPWVGAEELSADILNAIQRLRPDVVITFGEDGLYWHPDHIAVHERTTAAVASIQHDSPALYYVTMPGRAMQTLVKSVANTREGNRIGNLSERDVLGVSNAAAFGSLALPPTLVVDVGHFATQKLAAITCHRTQVGNGALSGVKTRDAERLLGIEHYRRAEIGSRSHAFIECFGSAPQ